jgi:pyruvate/2-oxoglutarate dehydrogenase complex dihydrolipoamide acyltransferase (E2) component
VSETVPLHAPFAGTVVAVWHDRHDSVTVGQVLVVIEAMKMEHEIAAEVDGTVRSVEVAVGDTVDEGQLLAEIAPGSAAAGPAPAKPHEQAASRDDLAAVKARHDQTLDAARPDAVAKRREQGRRTARENL